MVTKFCLSLFEKATSMALGLLSLATQSGDSPWKLDWIDFVYTGENLRGTY